MEKKRIERTMVGKASRKRGGGDAKGVWVITTHTLLFHTLTGLFCLSNLIQFTGPFLLYPSTI